MAIQQSINSAFNSLLAAAYTGTKAITGTEAYQKHQKIKGLQKNLEQGYAEVESLSDLYNNQVPKEFKNMTPEEIEKGKLGEATRILKEAGGRLQGTAGELLRLDPSAKNVEQYHEIASTYGSLGHQDLVAYWKGIQTKRAAAQNAFAAQQAAQTEVVGRREGMEERERMLGGENN